MKFSKIRGKKKNEWLLYLKNDVLSTAFSYARYAKCMEELTGFGIKNKTKLPSSANKCFNKLRDENYEPIYTYTDPFMRNIVRKSIKGARCVALNQSYKSTISEKVRNIFSKEVDVNGNICEILEKDFEYTNKQSKQIENKYDSQIRGYRDIDQEERTEHINKKLNKPPIH